MRSRDGHTVPAAQGEPAETIPARKGMYLNHKTPDRDDRGALAVPQDSRSNQASEQAPKNVTPSGGEGLNVSDFVFLLQECPEGKQVTLPSSSPVEVPPIPDTETADCPCIPQGFAFLGLVLTSRTSQSMPWKHYRPAVVHSDLIISPFAKETSA